MDDKYQCHICMELANKPVVTPCGHLFWYEHQLFKLAMYLSLAPFQSIISDLSHLQKWSLNVIFKSNNRPQCTNRKSIKWNPSKASPFPKTESWFNKKVASSIHCQYWHERTKRSALGWIRSLSINVHGTQSLTQETIKELKSFRKLRRQRMDDL